MADDRPSENFARVLDDLFARIGLTQSELARSIDIPVAQATVSRWLRGSVLPGSAGFAALERALVRATEEQGIDASLEVDALRKYWVAASGSRRNVQNAPDVARRRSLFVVMPFGTKPVVEEQFDFDEWYQSVVVPAADDAGWNVGRIDDTPTAGLITQRTVEAIVAADLMLAEISTPNPNVFYEIGLRHSVSAGGVLLVARAGTTIPFDLSGLRVIFYDAADTATTRGELSRALASYEPRRFDNPVRLYLRQSSVEPDPRDTPAAFERDLNARVDRAQTREQLVAVWSWARTREPLPAAPLLALSDKLMERDSWREAAEVLEAVAEIAPNDYEAHRKLGWCAQFVDGGAERALRELQVALALNESDPETLGMIGGILKRSGDFAGAGEYYDRAERLVPDNLYVGVNRAALAILRDPSAPEAGIELYRRLLERIANADSPTDEWAELVAGEASFAIGDTDSAIDHFEAALSMGATRRSLESAATQLELFSTLAFRPREASRLVALLRRRPTASATPANGRRGGYPAIVHISDLHFCSMAGSNVHRFVGDPSGEPLAQQLIRELTDFRSPVRIDPARTHVVVSGDITWRGSEDEFDLANESLSEIASALTIDHARVHVVPGNHDISWNLALDNQSHRFDNYISFLMKFYGQERFEDRYPHIPWNLSIAAPRPAPHELFSIWFDEGAGVLFVGLNSCVLENEEHHYGFVGELQLKAVRDALSDMVLPTDAMRVAVLHHHLHPYPEYLRRSPDRDVWVDLSTVRDSGSVESMLEKLEFDLVLHGHKHRPQVRETLLWDPGPQKGGTRKLIVCGAGSVSCTELEHAQPNQYALIETVRLPRANGSEFLRIHSRTLQVAPGAEWTTEHDWTIVG